MFNLTRQERQVILFLITVALTGTGIDFLVKINSGVNPIARIYEDIGKIELNSADKDLLMSVSGIGGKLGQRIIEYREKEGGFKELEELKNVKGISEYKYEKIIDSLYVK